jgi:AcrR family transcriptional regulator
MVAELDDSEAAHRQALIDAAKALAANGRPLTIAEVAEAARVSIATGYRYFSNPNDLVLEAATRASARSWPICPTSLPTSRTALGTSPSVHGGSGAQPRAF